MSSKQIFVLILVGLLGLTACALSLVATGHSAAAMKILTGFGGALVTLAFVYVMLR